MRDERVAQVGRAQEGVAPSADGVRAPLSAALLPRRRRARGRCSSARAIDGVDRRGRRTRSRARAARGAVAGGRASRASRASSSRQLVGYSPAWRRARARPLPRVGKSSKRTPRRAPERGRGLHAHPGLGDDAERCPREPSSMRSGRGPAPEPGRRRDSNAPVGRDRAHRLDEVVDVRVERREVAAGARRDPAAERRELEGLREVAQGEAVLGRAAPRAPGRARRPGCARRARSRRPRGRGPARARSSETAPRSRRRLGLDAADDARAAAVGDRLPRPRRAHSSTRATSSSSRGRATKSGGWSKRPRNARTTSRVALPRAWRRARCASVARRPRAPRAARRAAPAARLPRSARTPRRRSAEARGARRCRAASRESSCEGCSSS